MLAPSVSGSLSSESVSFIMLGPRPRDSGLVCVVGWLGAAAVRYWLPRRALPAAVSGPEFHGTPCGLVPDRAGGPLNSPGPILEETKGSCERPRPRTRLSCQDGSKANRRRDPARLREHVATFFIVVQRLRAKYRKVAWFAGNVVCAEFIGTMKVLFPEAKFAVVNHASFSADRHKRAYFASAEFDLIALARLTGTCTAAEFFDIDQARGPCLMRSGSSGSKSNCAWEVTICFLFVPFGFLIVVTSPDLHGLARVE